MSRLRELRRDKGKSLEHVALVGELNKATISKIERCLVQPRRETVARIAKGLAVSPIRLWDLVQADWEDSVPDPEKGAAP